MQTIDRLIQLVISVFLIVGVYQFYFWCQRNHVTPPREFRLPLDDRIPYRPRWVWIYSFLYYPIIVAINWTITSPRHFLYVAVSFMLLLGFQMVFFVLLPVATPAEWRTCVTGKGRSERFLAFVQSFDARSNSFPSMHTSVATLTAFDDVFEFVKESGLYEVQVTFLTAFPGTPLYDQLKREGRIIRDKAWELCTLFDINFRPESMSV